MDAVSRQLLAGGSEVIYADDVFSAWLRTGTGADATVNTGIDMNQGYMLWAKGRSGTTDHAIYDSARGATFDLASNLTTGQTTQAEGLKSVSVTGHTIGSLAKMNTNGATYVDWVFRRALKFFDVQTISHTNGTATHVELGSLAVVGQVVAKITNTTGDWITWHRSLTAGNNLRLNTTAIETTTDAWLSVSGTTATLASTAPTGTYVIYAFAHDTASDGLIQCGSYTGNGSSNGPVNELGWEPQFLLIKRVTVSTANWQTFDNLRGITVNGADSILVPNTTASETESTSINLLPTGFQINTSTAAINASGSVYVYLAIRRPNKPPSSGTQVFTPVAHTGTGSSTTVSAGFPTDMVFQGNRTGSTKFGVWDRSRKTQYVLTTTNADAVTAGTTIVQANPWDQMTGLKVGTSSALTNASSNTFAYWMFRRAKGFLDYRTYTGNSTTQRAIAHGLDAVPDMMIAKALTSDGANLQPWAVYVSTAPRSDDSLVLNSTAGLADPRPDRWSSASRPLKDTFYVGADASVNSSGWRYVIYLIASVPGISKVGSYTGNGGTVNTDGTAQTINCGFTTGARFVLIKRTDSTGDWFVFDTARGIVAAEDPYLLMNSTAAEVTSVDAVDTDSTGFIVNQTSGTNLNVTGASYTYLSIS